MLPVCSVSERATPAGHLSVAIHPVFHRANAATLIVPRFRWFEGIWPFRRLRISDLTADLSLTFHYIFHFFILFYRVCNFMNLILDLFMCFTKPILYGITTRIADEARWAKEPLDRLLFLNDFMAWHVRADILTFLSQIMHSLSCVTVLSHTLHRHLPWLSLKLFQILLDVIESALTLASDRFLEF